MSVAKAYAGALFEATQEKNVSAEQLDEIEAQLKKFAILLASSRDVRIALYASVATTKEKMALVAEFSRHLGFSADVLQFLTLLAKKNRLSLFSQITEAFSQVRLVREGGVSGQLVSAEEMSSADVSSLAQAFGQKLGKRVAFQVSTDPSLLAGMKVTVNGVTYDGTLRSQIQKLRDYFVAGLPGAHV